MRNFFLIFDYQFNGEVLLLSIILYFSQRDELYLREKNLIHFFQLRRKMGIVENKHIFHAIVSHPVVLVRINLFIVKLQNSCRQHNNLTYVEGSEFHLMSLWDS